MKKLLSVLYVILAIEVFCIVASSAIAQFQQKPMLGQQIDRLHQSGDPVGFWLFNEGSGNKVFDLSGGGVVGNLRATAHLGAGKFGSALILDGDSDYAKLTKTFSSISSSTTKTILAWVRSDISDYSGQLNNRGRILSLYQDVGSTSFSIFAKGTSDPATWMGAYRNPGYSELDSGVNVVAGEDVFIALVQNGSAIDIYINGVSQANANNAVGASVVSPPNADIGAFDDNPGDESIMVGFFDGLIDISMIYNRALSAGEIAELYREPFGMFVKDDIAMLATAVEPPPPPSGQVIMIQMSVISVIFALIFIRIKNGNKTI